MSVVLENVSIPGEGVSLIGRVYRPAPEGRYPAAVICLGYPGDTKNMDLAEELALSGIAVLVFYYKGAWGSGGSFRFLSMEASTRGALAYVRGLPYVDASRVALVSHSMGALPLTKVMASDPSVKAGALMSPITDISLWTQGDALETVIPHFLTSAKGKLEGLTADQLRGDLKEIERNGNPVRLVRNVHAPLLIVVGSRDEVSPPDVVKEFYDAAREPKKWVRIEGADHAFSEHRVQVIGAVIDWLRVTL
jgi:dipeptidyl aminopeptidase/acylaminoacyl peptidase